MLYSDFYRVAHETSLCLSSTGLNTYASGDHDSLTRLPDYILTPLLRNTFTPAEAVKPSHCVTLPTAPDKLPASVRRRCRKARVSPKPDDRSFVMKSSDEAYMIESPPRFVYQVGSTDISPARKWISSTRSASSCREAGTWLGCAIIARA